MEIVASTFLSSPIEVQNKLVNLTLSPNSGMSWNIIKMRKGEWPDVPVLYVRQDDGTIIGWCLKTEAPHWFGNYGKTGNEVQIFVAPEHRCKGVGRVLIERAYQLWGSFFTCPWNETAIAFFKKVGR